MFLLEDSKSRAMYLALLGAALALPSVAGAQSSSPSPSPAPSESTVSAPVESPAYVEARERQRRGRALLDAGNPNAALAEFQRVYDLLEGHPRRYMALSNIGRCYQALGEYDRAMEYYERYLGEAGEQAEDRVIVQASIAALNDLLGTVDIALHGPAVAEVWVDNRRMRDGPGRVRLPGGRHAVELRATGWQPFRREVQLSAHQTFALAASMEHTRRGLPPAVFIAGATATGVALLAGGVIGTIALVTRANIDAQLNDPTMRYLVPGEPSDREPLRSEAIAADVCFGAAGALGIATIVVAFLTEWHPRNETRPSPPRAILVPTTGAGVSGISLTGWF